MSNVPSRRSLRNHAFQTHATLLQQRARAAALQSELQALQRDLLKSSSAEHDAFVNLAKAECNQLCSGVMTQLPRELRDMVYRYLSSKPEECISREYFRSIMDPKSRMHTYDSRKWRTTHYPEHFWDAEYVGANFLQELIENYYRTSTFVFGDDDGVMESFLGADQMKMGYAPQELVSKIEIRLNAVTYDRSTCAGYMFGSTTKPERLQAALSGIKALKMGAIIYVHFSTRAKDEGQREVQLATACATVVPCLREAKLRGHGVRLVIDSKMEVDLEDTSWDCTTRAVHAAGCDLEIKA